MGLNLLYLAHTYMAFSKKEVLYDVNINPSNRTDVSNCYNCQLAGNKVVTYTCGVNRQSSSSSIALDRDSGVCAGILEKL